MTVALVDCPACGSPVSRSAPACPRCGHPVREDLTRGAVLRRSDGGGAVAASDTLGLLSLICGVVGLGVAFVPGDASMFGIVPSLTAVVLGSISLARVGNGVASGRGMAVIGVVTGLVTVVLFVFAVVGLSTGLVE